MTKTGIVVYLDFQQDKTLAFRSDIDALEIEEANEAIQAKMANRIPGF